MRRNQVMKSNGLALRSAGEGPLLLLLHGLGSSSLDWQAQIERFSEHYRVVALDLRGHGQSMQEGPFDVATLAADVVNWLDEQPEPAWVVGLSLGAMVALELVLQLPHKVRGLVLVNGFSEFLLETPKEQERYAQRLKWLRWFGMRPLAWWLGRELFPGPDLAQVRHTFRLRFVRSNKKKTYRALLDALPGWSVRARLGSIWQPVAIISTSHDYLPLAKRVEQFAALPNASIHTPNGHHAWPAEDPSGFNHLLQRILSTH
ncbi:alpha/beta hydrolase [Aeromonas salmonicida]|uniref:alpha/beta fold hydrolase n=1 Tax=Aeromonas salmonicida TaxID=645 RepID=UPI0027968D00|nr:alpha/beta hydrolase [Aeromonas salmonicida]MDQ1883322.1 alpha/beta hydrolase [Aeromonas salmonicida]